MRQDFSRTARGGHGTRSRWESEATLESPACSLLQGVAASETTGCPVMEQQALHRSGRAATLCSSALGHKPRKLLCYLELKFYLYRNMFQVGMDDFKQEQN